MTDQKEQNRLLSALLKIQHGDLAKFWPEVYPTAKDEPGLFAHVIAWNHENGRVRDSKVAFPVIALRTDAMGEIDLAENAVAHLASLGPRELAKAYRFSCSLKEPIRHGRRKLFQNAIQRYLEAREAKLAWWDAAVLRNRSAMKTLYAVSHKKPSERAQRILFERDYPQRSVFALLPELKNMAAQEAAASVLKHHIPITVAVGAGVKLDDPNVLLALVDSMTGTELITAANQLSKLKSWSLPVIQDAYNERMKKVSKDKRVNVLKASKATASAPHAAKQLAKVKEAAADSLKKIPGDWLVLADRSPSMAYSIEAGKQLAALLAHRVEGKVYLVFFDRSPVAFDVTGWSLDDIERHTKHLGTGDATSIGCGIRWLRGRKATVGGIVLISDGEENTAPYFPEEYRALGAEPALYFVRLRGGYVDNLSPRLEQAGIPVTYFDARTGLDYNSMVNVVNVLKPQTYGFLEEVMATPLKTLDQVFRRKEVTVA